MLIDHIGVIFLAPDSYLYIIFRLIGRISFPIFCFLLVEGFLHTSSFKKYALRLAAFAFVSEIPYNLAFYNSLFYPEQQNIFFTLFIGLCVLWVCNYIANKYKSRHLTLIPIIFGCLFAYFVRCDYDMAGILYIVVLFMFKDYKAVRNIGFILTVIVTVYLSVRSDTATAIGTIPLIITNLQLWAVLAMFPISFYNGQKGKISVNKYIFYLFYPAHLLVLYGISLLINFTI